MENCGVNPDFLYRSSLTLLKFISFHKQCFAKYVSLRGFFSCAFNKMFIEVPKYHEASPALKDVWLCAWYLLKCSKNLQKTTETQIGIHARRIKRVLVYNKVAGFQASILVLLKMEFIHIYFSRILSMF